LLDEFRITPNAVLFGTSSFWQGVDVKGESLSAVIIDKLPFQVPSDPLVSARVARVEREGGNPFSDYQVPHAVLRLKQGLGRLIRSKSDRGILSILDSRLSTKGYGKLFMSLPITPGKSGRPGGVHEGRLCASRKYSLACRGVSHVGKPCVFVRLTGCSLRCVWCDTKYAFGGQEMTLRA
jgi:hypothetical protein